MPDREPEHNYEYGAEHGGYSHVGIPPGCPACAAERQKAASAATPAAAILAEIRERHAKAADFAGSGLAEIVPGLAILWESATDVAPLLAAVERVLELHQPGRIQVSGYTCKRHEAHRFFSITATEAQDVRDCPDCKATVYNSCTGCGTGVSVDACPVREAVTSALTGKESTGEQ